MLNRPQSYLSVNEIVHEKVATSAHKLITLHSKATPDYINNSLLTVPGHLSNAPYNLFVACVSNFFVCTSEVKSLIESFMHHQMFYTHQLLSNPQQPGAAHFRSNLSDGISTFGKVREMPIADKCFKILVSLHPPPDADGTDNTIVRRDRMAKMRRVTFPYIGLADVSDIENIYPIESDEPVVVPKTEPDYSAPLQALARASHSHEELHSESRSTTVMTDNQMLNDNLSPDTYAHSYLAPRYRN